MHADNNDQQQQPLRMPAAPVGDNGDRSALGQAPPLPVNVPRGQDAAAPVGAAAAAAGPVGGINLQVAPPAVVPDQPDVKVSAAMIGFVPLNAAYTYNVCMVDYRSSLILIIIIIGYELLNAG